MKSFPDSLNVKNKDNFKEYFYNRMLCYLRRDIYEHILKEPETNYFSLDKFSNERVGDIEIVKTMIKELIQELEELGWRCKLGFGETGLFIYSGAEPPSNFWG